MELQSVVNIIAIGKISSYLCLKETSQQQLTLQKTANGLQWQQIAMCTFFLEQQYFRNPTDPTLQSVANYVYYLCGKYAGIARGILGQSGTIVTFVNNNTFVNVSWQKVQMIIGDQASVNVNGVTVPADGSNIATLPYAVMPRSEIITYQGIVSKLYPSNDYCHIGTYNFSSTLYAFYIGPDPAPFTAGYGLEFEFAYIVSRNVSSGASTGGTSVSGLQVLQITVTDTGNTLTVPGLNGTFVMAVQGNNNWLPGQVTQDSGDATLLDFTAVGGVTAGQQILIFFIA